MLDVCFCFLDIIRLFFSDLFIFFIFFFFPHHFSAASALVDVVKSVEFVASGFVFWLFVCLSSFMGFRITSC